MANIKELLATTCRLMIFVRRLSGQRGRCAAVRAFIVFIPGMKPKQNRRKLQSADAAGSPQCRPHTPERLSSSAVFSNQAWDQISRSLKLSTRESQILRGIFDDHTETAIAANLAISSHTVHTHIQRLHRKLGMVDRVQLVVRVVEEFLALTISPNSRLPAICANFKRCPFASR